MGSLCYASHDAGVDRGIGRLSGRPDMMPWDLVCYTCMSSKGVGGCSSACKKVSFYFKPPNLVSAFYIRVA